MSNQIKHKPLSNGEYDRIIGKYPLADLSIYTGARIAEIKRLVDAYETGAEYLDILTKYSGKDTNRFHLNEEIVDVLEKLRDLKGMSVRTFSRRYKDISEDFGVEFTSHNLRATFATRLFDTGVDIYTVSRMMNHKSISQTAKYIGFSETRAKTAAKLLVEYEVIEGMTIHETYKEIVELRNRLTRTTNELNREKKKVKELKEIIKKT